MKLAGIVFLLFSTGLTQAADRLLPADSYDPAVPQPETLLGHPVGQWHVRPDQLLMVMQSLANASDRVMLEQIGRTHERRPQVTLVISAPENLERLDELLEGHRNGDDNGPLVLWFGYSIHGNEASGSNASMLFAYYLSASRDPALEALLKNTIVLLDPSLNPDGLGRFATWVNSHRSTSEPVSDSSNREHREAWPGGRFNHYWFDLNRDWLPLVHPESRARVAFQQRWRPHVITDFHEMGSNQTYFFQPGVPSRRNPLTPQRNADLTAALGNYHSAALDALGQPYYTEETFDDFYYGKGSTYPDAQGAIGILFEQASVRGHLRATRRGLLSFRTAIRNQLATSMSTLRGAVALADELKAYQRGFDDQTADLAGRDKTTAYVIGDDGDPQRALALLGTLLRHQIRVYDLTASLDVEDQRFEPGKAWVIPTNQPKYRLLKSLFERRTEFADNTFYDVSAWNLALAYDLPHAALRRIPGGRLGPAFEPPPMADPASLPEAVAYAIDWHQLGAPVTLGRLLDSDHRVVAATRPFQALTADGRRQFQRGTLVVYPSSTSKASEKLEALIEPGLDVAALTSGLTPEGPDLGSPSLQPVKPVKPLLLVGPGVDPQAAGDAWHLLDTRVHLPPVMVEVSQLAELALHRYTHLLMVDGDYSLIGPEAISRIRNWVVSGGTLVASQRAALWATHNGLHVVEPDAHEDAADPTTGDDPGEPESLTPQPYGEYGRQFADTVIGGAVVQTDVDLTHPLAFGLRRPALPLLRRGTVFLKVDENPYQTPYRYASSPLLSGFIGPERRAQLAGSAAVIASAAGDGRVIRMADNPNFRGFWRGGNRLYLNALFFSSLINPTPLADLRTLH